MSLEAVRDKRLQEEWAASDKVRVHRLLLRGRVEDVFLNWDLGPCPDAALTHLCFNNTAFSSTYHSSVDGLPLLLGPVVTLSQLTLLS